MLILLTLVLSATLFVDITVASTTVSDVPLISVLSPIQNQTYEERDIWLNFTVVRPDSWTEPTISNPILPKNLGKITHISYILDETESEDIVVNDAEVWTIPMSIQKSRDFSFYLSGLSSGEHSIQVIVYGEVYVSGGTFKNPGDPVSPVVTAPVVTNSSIISFIVAPPTDPPSDLSPVPTVKGAPIDNSHILVLVSSIGVLVVGIAILAFYSRHNKRNQSTTA